MVKTLPARADIPVEHTWDLTPVYATAEAWEHEYAGVAPLLEELVTYKGRLDNAQTLLEMLTLRETIGKQVGIDESPAVTPDAVIYFDEDTGRYEIEMTHDPAPNLYINGMYRRMLKDRACDKKTREFLANNVRNARWLLESIEQRRNTIWRVIRAVVDAQQEFFDKGPEFLKPLPMIQVADQLGIHVATVSRAVSEKWIQTPRGIYPLRRFFSGGTTSADGEDMSWDAVKEKLKVIGLSLGMMIGAAPDM